MTTPKVYSAILNVAKEMQSGIEKHKPDKKGFGTPDYAFRGIDQVYNQLNPALVKNNLIIVPRFSDRKITERTSKNGGALFYITITGCFDFISSEDGSMVTVTTIGEAMDSGDKATNKAMSIAYKYACFQAFCIPTSDMIDPDADIHHVETNITANVEVNAPEKPILTKDTKAWERAIKVLNETRSLNTVKAHMTIPEELEAELMSLVTVKTKADDDLF